MRLLAPSLALTLVLAGCAEGVPLAGPTSESSPRAMESPPTVVGNWQLESGTFRGRPIRLVPGYRITLYLSRRTARGRSACNRYGLGARLKGSSVRFRGGSVSDMGCAPEVLASEDAYLDALASVKKASGKGETLVLSGPRTRLRFAALPPVPLESVVERVWVLENLTEGERSRRATRRTTLELGAEGQLVASTGCRKLSGTYVVDGDELVATRLEATGDCPDRLWDQSGHVEGVIGDGFTVALDGGRLIFGSMGGRGLVYRPQSHPDR